MIAETFDVGSNIYNIGIGVITLLTLIWNTKRSAEAAKSSAEAAKQIVANGGSSSFDTILKGQAEIKALVADIAQRVEVLENGRDKVA